jgi:ankyrin repeat protein
MLHIAINEYNLNAVKFLLENNHDVNLPDSHGRTPLENACITGNLELVQFLFRRGAILSTHIMRYAVESSRLSIVKFILDHGASFDRGLFIAASENWYHIVQHLLDHGDNPDNALSIAIEYDHCDIVELLLQYNANTERLDDDDRSPLHIAIEALSYGSVLLLLQAGAKPTSLQIAIAMEDIPIIKLLLQFGGKILHGHLSYAMQNSSLSNETIEFVLNEGVGHPAMIHALGNLEHIKTFHQHGCDPKLIKDKDGVSVFQHAILRKDEPWAEYLLSNH